MLWAPHQVAVLAEERVQWSGHVDVSFDESSIVVAESQEASDVCHVQWHRPVVHSLNLLGIRRDSIRAHNVSQVRDFGLEELAFRRFELEVRGSYAHKNLLQIPPARANVVSDHDYVVQVGEYCVVLYPSQHRVHQALKRRRRTSQSKRHILVLPV